MRDTNWQKCLLNGDSREIIKRIPDNSIDFILTDPPYNLAQHSTGNIPLPGRSCMNNDVAEWDMLDFNPEEWADDFIRILKPTGNLFIFTSYNQLGRWYNCLDNRFDTSNFLVWHKTNPAPKIFKAGFLNSCEMIFTCWNKSHTWNFISQKEMHNFLESPICMRPERLNAPKHPTQKPVSILRKMITIATNENDIVFDPFMGVGSTGVAAIELRRRFIGVEIDEVYCTAAKDRICMALSLREKEEEQTKNGYGKEDTMQENVLGEPLAGKENSFAPYPQINAFFRLNNKETATENRHQATGLPPVIKWPGGKEREMGYILANLPAFDRYFEPFVGGGAVFMGIRASEYYVNDLSSELMRLYRNIAASDTIFFSAVREVDKAWRQAGDFARGNGTLVNAYREYRDGTLGEEGITNFLLAFCREKERDLQRLVPESFKSWPCVLADELRKNLLRKMRRMRELEEKRGGLPEKDLGDNIETAVKSAVYMHLRHLYNDKNLAAAAPQLHCALFFFIRNYAYSGMFRYSHSGDFNVPYGGMAYNGKLLRKKTDYYLSEPVADHFRKARLYNLDFEDFLEKSQPTENDFVFLDPPYDSEFSTYDRNVFTWEDQTRLAGFLKRKCRAKWMMIIKDTDFIRGLYTGCGLNIRTFEKEYLVSFMNRNEKKATHLLITNYPTPPQGKL